MLHHDVEVGQRQACVLAGQALGALALAALDRIDEADVVAVGDDEDVARGRQLGLGEHERARPGERQRDDALHRPHEQRAARHLEQARMEGLVEAQVALEGLVVAAVHERLDRLVGGAQRREVTGVRAALGGEPRGRSLEHAAQLDGVPHVALGELAHHVAAGGKPAQQALVLQFGQREAHRGAAGAQQLHQRQLGHPLAGREMAVEDQLAQAEHRLGDLGSVRWPGQFDRRARQGRSRWARRPRRPSEAGAV